MQLGGEGIRYLRGIFFWGVFANDGPTGMRAGQLARTSSIEWPLVGVPPIETPMGSGECPSRGTRATRGMRFLLTVHADPKRRCDAVSPRSFATGAGERSLSVYAWQRPGDRKQDWEELSSIDCSRRFHLQTS